MDILIRQARIIDPTSPFHQQTTDVFIQNGFIVELGMISRSSDLEISHEGLFISCGWLDPFAHFCDPGLDQRETITSGASAAASGGFTDVMVVPNTQPVIHSKSLVEYLVQKSRELAVNIHPIGAVSKDAEGKDLAEMYDMSMSGAVAFSDGIQSIQSSGLLLKALQYLRAIDKTIIQIPDDLSITRSGLMNEGIISTSLGLPGKPLIAEELMILRDLELLKYTGGRLHITGISGANSIQLIRLAKRDGLNVSCSVTPYHLFFTDANLNQYDTNLKVNPPVRTEFDRRALIEGLMDGTIDCLATHHIPNEADSKIIEFEYARNGMTGLETAFAAVRTAVPELSLEKLADVFSTNARKIFGFNQSSIAANHPASMSLFFPEYKWTYTQTLSKSFNSAFKGKELNGKPFGIINKDRLFLNQLS